MKMSASVAVASLPVVDDAPPAGAMTRGLPRPPSSQRLFSTRADSKSYAVEVFGTDELSPMDSMRRHRLDLEAAGFQVAEREQTAARVMYTAVGADVALTIVAVSDDTGGCTTSVLASEVAR